MKADGKRHSMGSGIPILLVVGVIIGAIAVGSFLAWL